MKKLQKLFAVAMAIAMILAPANVFAANNYDPVSGEDMDFDKYLIVDEDAKIPAVEFEYTIAAGEPMNAASGKMAVLAGLQPGDVVIGKATFAEGEAASSTVAAGDAVTLDAGEKYAKKVVNVDFSHVSFPEPGIYRYILTEQEVAGRTDILYDTQKAEGTTAKQRIIDVYVVDNNGALQISQEVLHENVLDVVAGSELGSADVAAAGAAVADKSKGFVNEFLSANLEFGKEIIGNQGAKDKFFDFTLVLGNLQPGMTYAVDISKAQATSGSNAATIAANAGQTNLAEIVADENGAATVHYYLNDGQYVKVKGLPKDATYALTENAEDYKSIEGITVDIAGANIGAHTDAVSGTIAASATAANASADVNTGYTNQRNGIIPTGIASSMVVGGSVMAVAAFGLFASKKRKEEE